MESQYSTLDQAQQRIAALEAVAVAAHRYLRVNADMSGHRYYRVQEFGSTNDYDGYYCTAEELSDALLGADCDPGGDPAPLPPRYQPIEQGEGVG